MFSLFGGFVLDDGGGLLLNCGGLLPDGERLLLVERIDN
jgi:hypothetical protein